MLVAEDDVLQAEVIRRYLERDGYRTTFVQDGQAALSAARRLRPDLVVLDVLMPTVDGFEVCRALRRESDVLILMLTARSSEDDMLRGLGLGADDYLGKPYSPRELMARTRTLLRRAGRTPVSDVQSVGDLAVNLTLRRVTVGDRVVDCTPGEFEMLAAMTAQPGRVFTRRQLLERVGGGDRSSGERTVDVHVRNLRTKIEQDPRRPAYLVTVFGVGYKLDPGRDRAP
ncbi:DNA-binding response regulator, OmpR family, contains REC and winged-helix (wHTH) domain [Lentzea xinjiangensis]|uniref:DNA-binding response regulator, OmpR family, contains REC and winged-helix (WHTH) domain n=1 Tax=Lentzea xinjiangensis TaxID=402600 RepID=A0A1H9TRF2_9PSEU|nr:DNA-binding response regulator, OmpR family, contains REC and winged-helix (wHTH) domain [Lentzea xinjiangensis]